MASSCERRDPARPTSEGATPLIPQRVKFSVSSGSQSHISIVCASRPRSWPYWPV